MSLSANAIITVDELMGSMEVDRSALSLNMLSIYNSSSDATAATVVKVGNTLTLTVTGGANANTTAYDLSNASYDTIGELLSAIETLGKGWIANRLCASAQASTDMYNLSLSVLGSSNEEILKGFNTLYLEQIINSVSQFVEGFCKRVFTSSFAAKQHTEYHNGHGGQWLRLNNFPVTQHTSVVHYAYDTQEVLSTLEEHTEYEFDNDAGMIYKSGGWIEGHKNWRVIYTAGYTSTTMPEDLKDAVKSICKYIYNTRGSQGIRSERMGGYSVSYASDEGGKNRIMGLDIPLWALNLLSPYKKWDFPDEF